MAEGDEKRLYAARLHDLLVGAKPANVSFNEWCRRAKVSTSFFTDLRKKATIPSIDKVERLAREAGLSVDELLQGAPGLAHTARPINEELLTPLLDAILPLVPRAGSSAQSAKALSSALVYGLELLGGPTSTPASDDAFAVAARGAATRFRDLVLQ